MLLTEVNLYQVTLVILKRSAGFDPKGYPGIFQVAMPCQPSLSGYRQRSFFKGFKYKLSIIGL